MKASSEIDISRTDLECEKREPADGENGNDDDEHAHNAFPLVESLAGADWVSDNEIQFSRRRVEPKRLRDAPVRHQQRHHLSTNVSHP